MPRTAGAGFQALLSGSNVFWEAALYTLELAGSLGTLYWTDSDLAIVWGGHTFIGNGPIVAVERIRSTASTEVDEVDVTIHQGATTIGGLPVAAAAAAGSFDGAKLTVERLYGGGPGDITKGTLVAFVGWAMVRDASATAVQLSVRSLLSFLEQSVPRRIIQTPCPYQVGDAFCGATVPQDSNQTVASGTTAVLTMTNTPVNASANGIVTFKSGTIPAALVGLRRTIQSVNVGAKTITLAEALPVEPASSQAIVDATAGCDQSPTICETRFGNMLRFGGFSEFFPIQDPERWTPLRRVSYPLTGNPRAGFPALHEP